MKGDNGLDQGTNEKKWINSRFVLEVELVDIVISSLFFMHFNVTLRLCEDWIEGGQEWRQGDQLSSRNEELVV